MLKVGIIGFGKMGKIRYDAINASGKAQVVSIYDTNINMIGDNLRVSGSIDELINNDNIDTVFVCTPNFLNKDVTIKSLLRGKHVFCEKPPAFNYNEMCEIKEAETKSGRKLMYGFNHRHHDSIKMIKEMIDSKTYGKVLWMRGRYGKSVDHNFYNTWRADKKKAGGGILIDQGIHMLDLFLYLGGTFDQVCSFVSKLYWSLDIEDNVFAIYKNNQTGLVASLHSTMTQWRHLFSLEIFLEKGYFVLNGLKTPSGTYGEEKLTIARNRSSAPAADWKDEEHITFDVDNSWQSEVNYFLNCIIENNPVLIGNSTDAIELMKTIDKTYEENKYEG